LKKDNFWKYGFIFLFVILLAIISYLAFSYGKNSNEIAEDDNNLTPTPTAVANTLSDEELIKAAVYKKMGSDKTKLKVIVQKIEGDYAMGGITDLLMEAGGGYYLAAKKAGVWIVVHDGQASPSCTQLEGYSFPLDMVPECLNTKGAPVKLK
jgi:hypothetical protein